MCSWLLFTCIGICIALLIRSALRAVVYRMLEDGRWGGDWGVVISGAPPAEQDIDAAPGEPHCMAPGGSTNGAPNTGRGNLGLNVGG